MNRVSPQGYRLSKMSEKLSTQAGGISVLSLPNIWATKCQEKSKLYLRLIRRRTERCYIFFALLREILKGRALKMTFAPQMIAHAPFSIIFSASQALLGGLR